MTTAPVALFVYNRPGHTERTLEALSANTLAADSTLAIFSDAPRTADQADDVAKVRALIARERWGFARVERIEHSHNQGLARSVIGGVSRLLEEHDRLIVLEDDLVTSRHFLSYCNAALERYRDEPSVFSISGYNLPPAQMPIPTSYAHDVYFNPRCSSWGWATWRDRWQRADWSVERYPQVLRSRALRRAFAAGGDDLLAMLIAQQRGQVDSWAVRWALTHTLHGGLAVYPVHSFVDNIGRDGSGVHCAASDDPANELGEARWPARWPDVPSVDERIMDCFRAHYRKSWRWKLRRSVRDLLPELYRTRAWTAEGSPET